MSTLIKISLFPLYVSKVLCMLLNARLSSVAEEEGLIAEEQGGFRKQRRCREQVLSLVLLGQINGDGQEGRWNVGGID
jgi:hypothetical protein